MDRARVLLADDHDALLDKVGQLLDGECDVIGKVRDGQALLDAAEWLRPDLLIVDISMPIMDGIEAAHRLMVSAPIRETATPESGGRSDRTGGSAAVPSPRLG